MPISSTKFGELLSLKMSL